MSETKDQINESIWKKIEEYPGYEISNNKEIRNSKNQVINTKNLQFRTTVTVEIKNEETGDTQKKRVQKQVKICEVYKKYFPTEDTHSDKEWVTLKEFPNYEITKCGLIRNKQTKHLLKPRLDSSGYPSVCMIISANKPGRHRAIHVLVASTFITNDDEKKCVNHKDGNKENYNIKNLEWVTHSENINHAYENNLIKKSSKIIEKLDTHGNVVETYLSIIEAAKINECHKSTISYKIKEGKEYREKQRTELETKDISSEIWKNIPETTYKASNLGRIMTDTNIIMKPQRKHDKREIVSINIKDENGDLCKKTHFVHRLVALAFLPNPNNLPVVNHIDEDPTNNCVSNLEWTTYRGNAQHSNGKPIVQCDLDGNIIKEWASAKEVQRELKICNVPVSRCCRGESKTAGGYTWKYKE